MKLPPSPPPGPGQPAPGDEDPAVRVARLTALALGELASPEAGALEAAVWRDAGARLEMEMTRELAEQLTFAYAAEAPATLTAAQHRAILERAGGLTGSDEKDARLTAYALGELRPSQAEILSARLTGDRAATLDLEAVGALAARLRAGFASEPVLLLSLEQRHAIFEQGGPRVGETADAPAADPFPMTGDPAATVRPRRWLRTAALAAGFAAFGYVASIEIGHQEPLAATPSDPHPSPRQPEFFPPRPPTSSPAPAQLIALLDRETRRPPSGAAVSPPREIEPAAPVPAPVVAEAPHAPRRQPDASLLPPTRKAVARGLTARPVPGPETVLQSPSATGWTEPLAGFLATADVPAATLPTDLGRAGYDLVRQCVRDFGTPPPASLVRPEEIINQFNYDVRPAPGQDFAVAIEAAACPWNEEHQLVRVTVAAREAAAPPLRLTLFLRLAETPDSERAQLLAWQGLQALADRLQPEDSVALVVWGRARGVVLPPTGVAELENLREAPSRWHLGGPAPGPDDWTTVEQTLLRQAADNSRNLCLVLTDGPLDFTGRLPAEAAQRLRSMGAEMAVAELGPLRPASRAAVVADHAAAPFFRADSGPEAARLLAHEVLQARTAVAENVRLEVVFNPASLAAWRPVGFGSAGRPGPAGSGPLHPAPWIAGRQLTAMYEVVPLSASGTWPPSAVFASPAVGGSEESAAPALGPPLSVRLRYRTPGSPGSWQKMQTDWTASAAEWRTASPDFRLAAGAAAFALRLQDDPALGGLPLSRIRDWVLDAATADDGFGLRHEFADMIEAVDRLERLE